jgi:hypothetical protein
VGGGGRDGLLLQEGERCNKMLSDTKRKRGEGRKGMQGRRKEMRKERGRQEKREEGDEDEDSEGDKMMREGG